MRKIVFFFLLCICFSVTYSSDLKTNEVRVRGKDRITYKYPVTLKESVNPSTLFYLHNESDSTRIAFSVGPKTKVKDHKDFLNWFSDLLESDFIDLGKTVKFIKEESLDIPYFKKGKRNGSIKCLTYHFEILDKEVEMYMILGVIKSKKYYYLYSSKTKTLDEYNMGISVLNSLLFEKDGIFSK